MRRGLIICSIIAAMLVCAPVWAATIYVPDNQPTIQAAINAAGGGDEIIVRDGTYFESLTIQLKGDLIIRSENGAGSCIIDGGANQGARVSNPDYPSWSSIGGYGPRGVTIGVYNGSPRDAGTFDGFTVTGFGYVDGTGGGIYIQNGHTWDPSGTYTVQNCIISDNWSWEGGGLAVDYGQADVLNNVFDHNVLGNQAGTSQNGGGMRFSSGWAGGLVAGNLVINCNAKGGAGINSHRSSMTFENNVITGNWAGGNGGGGILIDAGDSTGAPTVNNCTIMDNSASGDPGGGGIKYGGNHTLSVENTILWHNDSYQYDYNYASFGGVGAQFGGVNWPSVAFVNCNIQDRSADGLYSHATFSTYVDIYTPHGGITKTNCIALDPMVVASDVWFMGNQVPEKPLGDPTIGDRGAGAADYPHQVDHVVTGGDYHLQAGSPCIDAGNPATGAVADFDGVARDATPDIGAYEASSGPTPTPVASCPAYSYESRGPESYNLYSIELDGSGSTDVTTYAWSQSGGTACVLSDTGLAVATATMPTWDGSNEFSVADATLEFTLTVDGGATDTCACYMRIPGDATGENFVNAADLAAFRSGNMAADFTGEGSLNAADLAAFRAAVAAGRGPR